MVLRRPLAFIAGLFREIPSGDAVPIDAGGTGAITAAEARDALGVSAALSGKANLSGGNAFAGQQTLNGTVAVGSATIQDYAAALGVTGRTRLSGVLAILNSGLSDDHAFRIVGALTGSGSSGRGIQLGLTLSPTHVSEYVGANSTATLPPNLSLVSLRHFQAQFVAIGGNASIQEHIAFAVPSGLAGTVPAGGAFYAFRSTVAAQNGAWNFIADGDAQNYFGGKVGIGPGKRLPSESLDVAGNAKFTGVVTHGQYTLTTLPSAAANSGGYIDVTNATGGPKLCRSNGAVWQIANTTTTVS